ncbi:NAD-dependent epimerase/dehydratase family protein [Armatimonas sp.]|uniref:NAD-dependent epimerase/dehydratase family protein n=1 Tax=Armatimonas sp. TaxID=1872638 RepID=UPI0037509094
MQGARAVLITGGTGFIGSALARVALERGWSVHLLGRDFSRAESLLAAGARAISCDLRSRDGVVAACEGVDMVFHIGAFSAPWGDSVEFHATNVGGTENILAACRVHKIAHLVHVSSPSVVFTGCDQWQLPDDAPYPKRFASVYSQTKKLAEDRVNAAFAEGSGLSGVILRPKAVFGPGDTSLLPRLIAAARAGRLPRIGEGKNLVELTYIDNAVAALLCAADAPKAALGKTFTITNHEVVPLWEVIAQVLAGLKIPWQPRTIPLPLALLAASLMERKAERTGKEPLLTRYTVQLLARTQTYDTQPARKLLGYMPQLTLSEGIARTIQALT